MKGLLKMANNQSHDSKAEQNEDKLISVTCPKCDKNYGIYKKRIPRHKKLIAKCKSCGHRFPMLSHFMFSDPSRDNAKQKQQPDSDSTARTIAVSLSKGGVGKTTTAVNLSAGLALSGFKVLLVDTDTQGQDSYMLGIKPVAGLTELLTKEVDKNRAIIPARKNLWLLSGGKSLAGVKRIIDRKDFGGEMMLSEALSPLENLFDYIVVDTSPGWDPLTVNVLFYVKEILVPVALDVMALQGLIEFLKSLSSIQNYRKDVSLKYIVPTFLDNRIGSPGKILNKLLELYEDFVCSPIHYNSSFADAPAFGQTTYEFAPGSTGTDDFKKLVRRVAGDESLLI